jgi:hypothetical protein
MLGTRHLRFQGDRRWGIASGAVHRGGLSRTQKLSPMPVLCRHRAAHSTPSTSAQTAIVARNRVSDANARASSATARTMTMPLCFERTGNIVLFLFSCQDGAVGQFKLWRLPFEHLATFPQNMSKPPRLCRVGVLGESPNSKGAQMDRTAKNRCSRCGQAVTLVTAVAPTGDTPGIIAWECLSCGKADSILVSPMRARSHGVYEAMPQIRS